MARVLVVNDDGIDAPGLHAIVAALARDGVAVYVAAPTSERSATGHGITIHAPLVAVPVSVPHAREAYAVTGLPADCTMLALGPLFAHLPGFDLVVSGINRGNNYGLHVVYSGTVAAAREAAAQCVPAVALSLNAYTADADYTHAAAASLPIIRCMLRRFGAVGAVQPGNSLAALLGSVVNVNVPAYPLHQMRGYVYTRQSYETTLPSFAEVAVPDAPLGLPASAVGAPRAWLNGTKYVARIDREPGTDAAAVADGYVAVSLVRLLSDAAPVGEVAQALPPQPPPQPALDATALTDAAADYVLDVAAAAAQAAAGAVAVSTKLRPPLAAAPAETSSL